MKRTVRILQLAAIWLVSTAALAAQAPTSEQLEIFRNLTPEQQQAILRELDEPRSEDSSPSTPGAGRSQATEPDDARRRAGRPAVEEPRIPVLQSQDTV